MTNSLECLVNDGPTRAIRFNFEWYDEECLNVHIKVTYPNTHRCNADVARAVGTQLVGKIRRMQGALETAVHDAYLNRNIAVEFPSDKTGLTAFQFDGCRLLPTSTSEA